MTRRLVFRPEAESEALQTRVWYDEQRIGLAAEFSFELERALEFLCEYPLASLEVHGGVRRRILRRFPYAVLYMVTDDEIVVLKILHGRRDPLRWKRDLEG